MAEVTIPEPKTKFLRITCKCGHEQVVFSNPAMDVKCEKCKETIAYSSAGTAKFVGKQEELK